jgi:asparagine synthase (glutamine-hydrolysing)
MCGIAGLLYPSLKSEDWQKYLEAMDATLAHRGPDDNGLWFDVVVGVGLAHRRLSIIDLSPLGHQPMFSPSGRYVISYNGEVYNFKSLRMDCEKAGLALKGGSDTEVILAAIELWGIEAAVKKFTGMFAFALWDRQERALCLCRDRLGKKPLYYGQIGRAFCFGSELKAMCALPFFKREIDRDVLAMLVQYTFIPSPFSIYKDIVKVPPGSIIRVKAENGNYAVKETSYWSLLDAANYGRTNPFEGNSAEAVEELDTLLSDAVQSRMISDVPLGAFLSGGIDSSTIVALMQKQSSIPVKTFSIGNFDMKFNEAGYAKEVARYLGTDHTEFYVSPQDVLEVVPSLPDMFDEPLPDSSQIPTFLVSKLSRSKVTVALTGDGGDEVFGGYERYKRIPQVWNALSKAPGFLRQGLLSTFRQTAPLSRPIVNIVVALLRKQGRICNYEEVFSYISGILSLKSQKELFHRYLSNETNPTGVVLGSKERETMLSSSETWPDFRDFEHAMMYVDSVSYLSEDILVKVDRASMAVSLETRIPLLDHRVVEFAWRLPLIYKMRNKQSKWILRQVLNKYVPRNLVERPKMGFGIPIGSWIKKELRSWAEALLDADRLKREGIFDPVAIRQKWMEHVSGERDWHYYLWNILTFQAWFEKRRKM